MVDLAVTRADVAPRRPVASKRDLPAWPVTALVALYPVWWALGLGLIAPLAIAAVMAAMMVMRQRTSIVPGVLPWLAFCIWVIPCGLMLDSGPRTVIYALRAAQFFSVAVVLVYVVNARATYTMRRLILDATLLWGCVVVGGYLGLLFPGVRLTTFPGLALPPTLARDEFLRDIFFPPLAEVQSPWGAPQPFVRPAAPFPYTNNWGGAIAILTPVALAGIGVARRNFTRVVIVLLLAASLVPIGASSNRGMFLGLAVGLGYVAVRLAMRGHWVPFAGLAVVGLAGLGYYVFGGAAAGIENRQQYSNTTSGRGTLYAETLERTLQSPILGWGGPRPSYTTEVSVGTQGWIWQVMFSFGFVGLALFLWFLWGLVLRTWRAPGTARLLLHASLVTVCVLIGYYGLHIAQLTVIGAIAGVMLRDVQAKRPPG
jgi:hypothetical protein